MSRKNSPTNIAPLKNAIDDLLKNYGLTDKFRQTQVVASWERIMGKPITSRTRRIFFKDKKLFIEISSAPLKHELMMSRDKIKEALVQAVGEGVVDEIVLL